MKKKVLIVGTGDIGTRLLTLLRNKVCLEATYRQKATRATVRQAGARAVAVDLDKPSTLRRLSGTTWDAVIHLAPPPNHGQHDQRTRHLLRAILPAARSASSPSSQPPARRLPVLVYVSTTGVYGDCAGAWVQESQPCRAQSARAKRRVDAERSIERAVKQPRCTRRRWRAVILRAPGIYSAERLPLDRLRAGTPAIVGHEDSYTNHIHAEDLARLCVAALRTHRRFRIYNACDYSSMKMGDWFDAVADTFQLPRPPRLRREEVRQRVSPALWSFMNESRRVSNARLVRECRTKLRWPTVTDFLNAEKIRLKTK